MHIRIVERSNPAAGQKTFVIQEKIIDIHTSTVSWKDKSVHGNFNTAEDAISLIYNRPIPDKVIKEYSW